MQDALGIGFLYTIWDVNREEWFWRMEGAHRQREFLGFRLQAEVDYLSDPDFFQEFGESVEATTRRQMYSQFFMTRTRGAYTLNLRADHRTTFYDSGDVTLAQIPEAELRMRANRIGSTNLFWNMISSVNIFNTDKGGDYSGTYGRADLFPEISYSLPSPPLAVGDPPAARPRHLLRLSTQR